MKIVKRIKKAVGVLFEKEPKYTRPKKDEKRIDNSKEKSDEIKKAWKSIKKKKST